MQTESVPEAAAGNEVLDDAWAQLAPNSGDEFADVNSYFEKHEQISEGSGEWEQVATPSSERPVELFSIHSGASSSHEGELRPVGAARLEGVAIGNCSRTPPHVHAEPS